MRREKLIAVLALPILAIVVGIVRAELHLAVGRTWLFDVQGYDPRDLLRGQYIQYQVALHEGAPLASCNERIERCCLCLTQVAEHEPPTVARASCATAAARCDGWLDTRYLEQLRRYYIPEARAEELSERLRVAATEGRARIRVSIDPDGKPQVDALLVDGLPIEREPSRDVAR